MDYLQFIFQAINNLLTQNLGFFDAMGQNLFRAFATILVVWFGVKSALSSAGGGHMLHFDNFASLLLTVSFGFAMVNYYNTPIPGVGVSFHNLVTNEAQFLSGQIDQAQLQTVVARVADFESRMDSPTWGDILGTAIYVIDIDGKTGEISYYDAARPDQQVLKLADQTTAITLIERHQRWRN